MSDDDDEDLLYDDEVWLLEGHDGRSKFFEARVSTMSQYHMRQLLQQLAARHLTPQQIVDATTARTNDLEIDELPTPDKRVTLGTRGNPRYVAALYMSRELKRLRR